MLRITPSILCKPTKHNFVQASIPQPSSGDANYEYARRETIWVCSKCGSFIHLTSEELEISKQVRVRNAQLANFTASQR